MANVLGELFGDIASAIREKTGDEGTMKPAQFPEKISGIETGADVSGVTATAADVRAGKSFVDATGKLIGGAIYAQNPAPVILNTETLVYRIPKGFHDGYGYVRAFPVEKTVIPTKEEQMVFDDESEIPNFLNYVRVRAIPDEYQDVTGVTATAEDVLAGKVFVDAEGNEVEGTLVVNEVVENVVWGGASDSVTSGLAANGVIRYVTFMNHDGTVEYGRKSVLAGEDCVDPVTAGHMDTPTRESTAQYNYTFAGWATVPNGGLNANALKAVTEDRTVYANFVSAVRYYTITFYDSDGTTVLDTRSVAYGSVPNYKPTKDGYDFVGWTVDPVAVTGEASYIAVWNVKATFETATWEQIKAVCDAGNHATTFAIGDKKPVTLTYEDGTSETINFTIVDMNVDVKKDGSKAALTLMADNLVKDSLPKASSVSESVFPFYKSTVGKNFLTKIYNSFPDDLRSVMATVQKYNLMDYIKYDSNVFIPDAYNLDGRTYMAEYDSSNLPAQTQYAYFKNGGSALRKKLTDENADDYWVNSAGEAGSSYYRYWYFDGDKRNTAATLNNEQHGIVPCFCI